MTGRFQPMRFTVTVIPCLAILIGSARGGQIKDDFEKLGDAARVFAVTEGGTAEYRLGLLTDQVKPVFGSNLNVFEREFPKLNIDQQTMLTLLILTNYDFEGEYSIRFRVMIEKSRLEISRRIEAFDRKKLKTFVNQYGQDFRDLAERCDRFLGFRPK